MRYYILLLTALFTTILSADNFEKATDFYQEKVDNLDNNYHIKKKILAKKQAALDASYKVAMMKIIKNHTLVLEKAMVIEIKKGKLDDALIIKEKITELKEHIKNNTIPGNTGRNPQLIPKDNKVLVNGKFKLKTVWKSLDDILFNMPHKNWGEFQKTIDEEKRNDWWSTNPFFRRSGGGGLHIAFQPKVPITINVTELLDAIKIYTFNLKHNNNPMIAIIWLKIIKTNHKNEKCELRIIVNIYKDEYLRNQKFYDGLKKKIGERITIKAKVIGLDFPFKNETGYGRTKLNRYFGLKAGIH